MFNLIVVCSFASANIVVAIVISYVTHTTDTLTTIPLALPSQTRRSRTLSAFMTPFTFRWTGQHDEQSKETFFHTDWDGVLDIAKRLSGDSTCAYQGDYHAGGRHIVRRIEVPKQDELWIARIPTIPMSNASAWDTRWWTREQQFTMESEIATMKFIAQATDIPVPKVFGYNTRIDGNPARLPYLLMQCIEGNMLFDLGGPDILTDKQRVKIRKSVASIQVRQLPKLTWIRLILFSAN
jgi:hypothetical protein